MKKKAEQKPVVTGGARPDHLTDHSKENATETVVIYDECGDTQWDRVLAQDSAGLVSESKK
jgi:hypothetical protein